MDHELRKLIIFSVIIVALQLIIAPNIAFFGIVPNFIVPFVVVVLILTPYAQHYVFAFVMGMISDLIGYGPVGAMALCLTLAAFFLPRIVELVGNDSLATSLGLTAVTVIGIELVYGLFLIAIGGYPFVDAMVYRALPCGLYDSLIGVVCYFVAGRIFETARLQTATSTTPNLRFH